MGSLFTERELRYRVPKDSFTIGSVSPVTSMFRPPHTRLSVGEIVGG